MTDPAARYHRWLEDAREATTSPTVHRLIDELHADLHALGPFGAEVASVVRGALASVATAIELDRPVPALVPSKRNAGR